MCVCVVGVCARLTSAGVGGRARPPAVPVEAGFARVTPPALGVVQAVADASAALAGLAPRRPVEAAALGVLAALALWREKGAGKKKKKKSRKSSVCHFGEDDLSTQPHVFSQAEVSTPAAVREVCFDSLEHSCGAPVSPSAGCQGRSL